MLKYDYDPNDQLRSLSPKFKSTIKGLKESEDDWDPEKLLNLPYQSNYAKNKKELYIDSSLDKGIDCSFEALVSSEGRRSSEDLDSVHGKELHHKTKI